MGRFIGIRHRVKQTAKGEARPTQVCIVNGDGTTTYVLETETDELDWVLGEYPLAWRLAIKGEDDEVVSSFRSGRLQHHLRWRKVRKNEDPATLQERHVVKEDDGDMLVLEIPNTLDGFRQDDTVGMTLGGSGDRLSFALSRRADELGGASRVLRSPPIVVKSWREAKNRKKDEDAQTIAEQARDSASAFFVTTKRDRDLIRLGEAWRNRMDAMKARIAAEQRLCARLIGELFCSEEGRYPEGEIELAYDRLRANDGVILALLKEENARNREVEKILNVLDVYNQLFASISGVGPAIAARLIVAVGDIRRFQSSAKLKAFLGAHVLNGSEYGHFHHCESCDATYPRGAKNDDASEYPNCMKCNTAMTLQYVSPFPRRREGKTSNWHPEGRQALYLLADQFNRRPETPWGQRLLHYKAHFRSRHPEVVEVNGKKRYTKGHIHRMALWRTATKFVEWLWKEWTKLEREAALKTD